MLNKLLGSKLRAKTLGWLFTHADERFFVRQLTTLLHEDSTNLSRELARLEKLGVLICRTEGRQKYYQANQKCSVFPELRGLVIKTAGMADALRAALTPVSSRVHMAFLYGSFASGQETAASDIDLFVVGDLSAKEAAALLQPAGRELGREINFVIYAPAELRQKMKEGHHFVTEVLKARKLYLAGDENDLRRIVR